MSGKELSKLVAFVKGTQFDLVVPFHCIAFFSFFSTSQSLCYWPVFFFFVLVPGFSRYLLDSVKMLAKGFFMHCKDPFDTCTMKGVKKLEQNRKIVYPKHEIDGFIKTNAITSVGVPSERKTGVCSAG